MKKFNGFENAFIRNAVKRQIADAEAEVLAAQKGKYNTIFAPGYFTMIGTEMLEKIDGLTLKKDLKFELKNRDDENIK